MGGDQGLYQFPLNGTRSVERSVKRRCAGWTVDFVNGKFSSMSEVSVGSGTKACTVVEGETL